VSSASKPVILFTGFPGFLGRELLPRVVAREPGARAVCLVQAKFLGQARDALRAIEARAPGLAGRVELVTGDITTPGLALANGGIPLSDVSAIYHLAAVYDLGVGRDLAVRVNVDGTRNVLDFAARCPHLQRLHYVSTCYVSGRYVGAFAEDDLEKGQAFNNFYEETKYQAEVLVRERMRAGLPATIYRPSIVVGDSKTGATQKLDGPYYFLRWLVRQPKVALMPVIDAPERFRFNVVPCDFVVDAITYLSGLASSLGKTYQLCDPAAPTCAEFLDIIGRASGRRIVRVPLSSGFARFALESLPGVHRVMQLPPSLVDYMTHPTHYYNRATMEALAPGGIAPPPFAAYAPAMAAFVRDNLALGSAAMV
jgi:thioester reductase-like protein